MDNPSQEQVQEIQHPFLAGSTTAGSTPTVDNSEYPKGFKFILPKSFKGDQEELEPWLFNIKAYFKNTNLSINKWL